MMNSRDMPRAVSSQVAQLASPDWRGWGRVMKADEQYPHPTSPIKGISANLTAREVSFKTFSLK